MSTQAERAAALRKLLAHVREAYGLDLGFVLWDGSTVPADHPPGALAASIADDGVIAALVRRPTLDTVADLWVTGRIDLRNGSVLDLLEQRPRVRSREFRRRLDKFLALRSLSKFLLRPRGGPWPLEAVRKRKPGTPDPQGNKDNIQYHYDLSNAFYALFLDPEMVYSCGYFTEPHDDIARAQRDKLEMTSR